MIREGGRTSAKNRDIAGQTADDDDEQERSEACEAMTRDDDDFIKRAEWK